MFEVKVTLFVPWSLSHIQAIHGYRETERLSWGAACEEVLNRVRSAAFPEGSPLLGPVHILDLDKTGYIKPHIDSVKVGLYGVGELHKHTKHVLFRPNDSQTNSVLYKTSFTNYCILFCL